MAAHPLGGPEPQRGMRNLAVCHPKSHPLPQGGRCHLYASALRARHWCFKRRIDRFQEERVLAVSKSHAPLSMAIDTLIQPSAHRETS